MKKSPLPCPFCGAPAKIGSEEPFFRPDRFMFYIFHSHPYPHNCPFRKSGGLATDFFDTEKEAVSAWNHREPGQLTAAAFDMLEALENIENDDKHMPNSAWKMIQAAIAKAKAAT